MIKVATKITIGIGFCIAVSLASAQGTANDFLAAEGNLSTYLGHTQGHYAPSADSLVFDQFVNAFGALDTTTKPMMDGDTLLSARSASSLTMVSNNPLGAAVLLGPDKQVKGAALVHYACRPGQNKAFNCNDSTHPVLTIFLASYKKNDGVVNTFIVSKFRTWAMNAVGASMQGSGHKGSASHLKIQVREVGSQSS